MRFSIKRSLLSEKPGQAAGMIEFVLTDEELTKAYWTRMRIMEKEGKLGDYQQWVADTYHCSGCWGQKMTDEEMLLNLAETRRQSDPDDYVPDITLYKECAEYWNALCDRHPN